MQKKGERLKPPSLLISEKEPEPIIRGYSFNYLKKNSTIA
jgi:hypothetical protein